MYRLIDTTHTHPFNGPLSRTTRVSRYQKGNTNLDFTEERHSEWQRHQLGHMHLCTSLQTDNYASTPLLNCFTGRMPFLLPCNQQRQSTEGSVQTDRQPKNITPPVSSSRRAKAQQHHFQSRLLLLSIPIKHYFQLLILLLR